MEKFIKTNAELTAILTTNPYHIWDYTQGFIPKTEIYNFTVETFQYTEYYLSIYSDYTSFMADILSNLNRLDLTEGADDQYYDYNTSCLEAIIAAFPIMETKDRESIIPQLISKIKNFIEDENQDEDMIFQYSYLLGPLIQYRDDYRETKLFQILSVSPILETLNK